MPRYTAILTILILIGSVASAQRGRIYKSMDEVKDPEQVYHLQLRHKRLKTVPAAVLRMRNLEYLDMRGNKIAHLPDSISSLQHLQTIDLSRNPLMGLPPTMGQMESLQELILWSTYVTDLPAEMERLDGTLQLIDLRDCPLTPADQQAIESLLPSVRKQWDYPCECGD